MEFKQLRYFVAIAESLSFSKAADKLYITQPALSQQISKLEDELGVTLIERNTRSVQLTDAGRDLYGRSIIFLNEMENLIQAVITTGTQGFPNRTIKICLEDDIFSLAYTGAYEFLKQVSQSQPDLVVDCFPVQSASIPRLLQERDADLALAYQLSTSSPSPNLIERCFYKGRLALAVPGNWNFEFGTQEFNAAFNSASFFFPHERTFWHGVVTSILAQYDCHPHHTYISNYETAVNYAAAGCGVFFAPEVYLNHLDNPYIRVIPIPHPNAEYRVSALYSQVTQSQFLLQLLEFLPKLPYGEHQNC